jgi:GNAT superfamily N-acetyltransferase
MTKHQELSIEPATPDDVPVILAMIRELAEYEKLCREVRATEADLRRTLFGERAYAEVLIARCDGADVGFALFFHNYSTFLGAPGLYLEDLFVRPKWRGRGFGRDVLSHLAGLARERGCGRMEWWVLDWNESAIRFYKSLGAEAMSDWTVYRLTHEKLAAVARG